MRPLCAVSAAGEDANGSAQGRTTLFGMESAAGIRRREHREREERKKHAAIEEREREQAVSVEEKSRPATPEVA